MAGDSACDPPTLVFVHGGFHRSWVWEAVLDRPTDVFYNDVEPRVAAWAQNRLLPTTFAAFTEPLTAAAWRNIPSTYITCERDQALPLHAQEAMAQRAESVQRLSAGHSPMLSRPSELAEIINGVAAQK
jgi:pimeloyl-ACP methyl ester carboxylesterase